MLKFREAGRIRLVADSNAIGGDIPGGGLWVEHFFPNTSNWEPVTEADIERYQTCADMRSDKSRKV